MIWKMIDAGKNLGFCRFDPRRNDLPFCQPSRGDDAGRDDALGRCFDSRLKIDFAAEGNVYVNTALHFLALASRQAEAFDLVFGQQPANGSEIKADRLGFAETANVVDGE